MRRRTLGHTGGYNVRAEIGDAWLVTPGAGTDAENRAIDAAEIADLLLDAEPSDGVRYHASVVFGDREVQLLATQLTLPPTTTTSIPLAGDNLNCSAEPTEAQHISTEYGTSAGMQLRPASRPTGVTGPIELAATVGSTTRTVDLAGLAPPAEQAGCAGQFR